MVYNIFNYKIIKLNNVTHNIIKIDFINLIYYIILPITKKHIKNKLNKFIFYMKIISENLKSGLNKNSLNIVKCYNIFLKNGEKLYFTQSSNIIFYNNIKYIPNSGIEGNNIKNYISLEVENTGINGFIDNEIINRNDILSGKFDNAEIEIFLLDLYLNEKITIFNGYITNISYQNNIFIANIKNKTLLLEKIIGDTYSPLCRCCFCDKKCGLNKDNYTIKGVISEIINQFRTI